MRKPGVSEETRYKLHTFAGIVQMHTSICSRMQAPYWYFDLNAGYGDGSPARAYPHLVTSPLDWTMVLCEHNPDTFNRLADVWSVHDPRIILHNADNTSVARAYAKRVHGGNGIVFHDPNGVDDFNIDALRVFQSSRLDLVVYYSAAAHKRVYHAPRTCKAAPYLIHAILESGIKKYWLVRQPRDKWQWAFIIGTNWSGFPEWRKHGIYQTTSPEGRAIVEKLHYTRKELAAMYQERIEGL